MYFFNFSFHWFSLMIDLMSHDFNQFLSQIEEVKTCRLWFNFLPLSLFVRFVSSFTSDIIQEFIDVVKRFTESILKIVWVFIEVGVEWTVSWPAEVLYVFIVTEQVVLLVLLYRDVAVNLYFAWRTLLAFEINSIFVCPFRPIVEAINNFFGAFNNWRFRGYWEWKVIKSMNKIEAESIGVDPIVKLEPESSDELRHSEAQLVVPKPFQLELRFPRSILCTFIIECL